MYRVNINVHVGDTCVDCSVNQLCMPSCLDEADHPLFDAIVDRSQNIRKGESIFEPGSPCTSLLAVMKGGVKKSLVDRNGKNQITGFYMPGELLGYSGFATGEHTVSAIALQSSIVCEIPLDKFDALSHSHPELCQELRRKMGLEIRREQRLASVLGKLDARSKLAAFIIDISSRVYSRSHEYMEFDFSMNRQDIANFLGLAVETLSRAFHAYEEEEIIACNKKHIRILDRKRLLDLSGEDDPVLSIHTRDF